MRKTCQSDHFTLRELSSEASHSNTEIGQIVIVFKSPHLTNHALAHTQGYYKWTTNLFIFPFI